MIAEYQKLLFAEGWRPASNQQRETLHPTGPHGAPAALWLERPVSSNCSQLLSFQIEPFQFLEDEVRPAIIIFDQYEQVCDDERRTN
jgi:hypothetical protein